MSAATAGNGCLLGLLLRRQSNWLAAEQTHLSKGPVELLKLERLSSVPARRYRVRLQQAGFSFRACE
jgi:hypothetical protein